MVYDDHVLNSLSLARLKREDDNYVPVPNQHTVDLKTNGGTPIVDSLVKWLNMDDNPTSEADTVVTTVSSIEIVGMVTAATLEFDKFFGATALTNGVKIEIKLRSFTILQVTIKSLADLIKYFDTVTFTTDTKATTPNTLVRAVKKLDVMVNLLDSAKDAILVTVSDNNTGISTAAFIQCIIRGYGYVPR